MSGKLGFEGCQFRCQRIKAGAGLLFELPKLRQCFSVASEMSLGGDDARPQSSGNLFTVFCFFIIVAL